MSDFSKRIPELDGIRGLAILLVLGFHFIASDQTIVPRKLEGLLGFGWSGVDLFFVLSGFLIGGILLDARDSANYFKVFYVRRFYRILPPYGALCLLCVALSYAHLSTHAWLFEGKVPWYAYLTFGQNFWMAEANGSAGNAMVVTWSLAVEEQLYLTLPLVIRTVSRKSLPHVLGIGVLLAPLIRVALWFALDPAHRTTATYVLAPCRMDALLSGVLAAWAVRSGACWDWLVAHKGVVGTASVGLGVGILEMIHKKMGLGSFGLASFGYTWLALFYLSLLLLAVTQHGFVSRLFRFRPLTELGILAYGLYLFHSLVIGVVYGLAGKASPQLTGVSTVGLTLLSGLLVFTLTRLSWRYFEKPLISRGHRYQYRYERVCGPVVVPVTVKLCEFPLASVSGDAPVERQIENHSGNRQMGGANARYDVAPGAVRAEESIEESRAAPDATADMPVSSPEIIETKESLRFEREHLERAKNEATLLQRKLNLDTHTVYSNPEYTLQRSAKAKLTVTQNQIAEKQDEIQQTQQKIAQLEEHLQDLRLNSPDNSKDGESAASNDAARVKAEEKGEDYWRKQFAEIHYKIRMRQSELDISQRELNEALLIYDPNPQKSLRENVTGNNINAHRKAIEDKKKELAEFRRQLSDLEDELRQLEAIRDGRASSSGANFSVDRSEVSEINRASRK